MASSSTFSSSAAATASGSGGGSGLSGGRWVPQHHRDITLGRLDAFLAAGQFADVTIRSELWASKCGECVGLEVYNHPKDVPYPSYDAAVRMPYLPVKVGDAFGPSWTTHWFRVRAKVPPEWDGRGPLMFRWDSGSEAMLYPDGPTPRQGITDQRNEYLLAASAVGGQELLFYVEMSANGMFGNTPEGVLPPDENKFFTLKAAELAIPNLPVTALFHDLRALVGLARELPAGNATGETALYTANKIVNAYRLGDPRSVEHCRALAASVLAVRDGGERLQVYAVGHCHIDTAWLWPFSETHRKTARSWSAQLRLAERYPWHVFTASSAQQYEWLQQDYPGLFTEIQAASKRGSFVPVGGTWVEMDTNLPSGESLVRQFLFGQRYFAAQFGAPCDVFWLPDTFGYSGQLPQIAAGAGIRYFLTQKLSWNNINAFPHSSFYWAGLDGSRLLTHFPPANTYNAQADAHDILATATGSKDKDRAPAAYMLYGNGDGGGGPTVDMCESLARLAGCRGLASLTVTPPGEFFKRLEAGAQDLLTWRGELYFELHRGTYTSHAANKSDNRTCELLLREAEAAGALAAAVLPPGTYCYPRSELEAIWKDVLLYQFHDVLPGSAIGRVYDVTKARYPQMMTSLRKIREAALEALLAATAAAATTAAAAGPSAAAAVAATATSPSSTLVPSSVAPDGDLISFEEVAGAKPLAAEVADGANAVAAVTIPAAPAPAAWVFNSLAFPRREVVTVPLSMLPPGADASTGVMQRSADGASAVVLVEAPPLSLTPVTAEHIAAGFASSSSSGSSGSSISSEVDKAAEELARMELGLGRGGEGAATCCCVPASAAGLSAVCAGQTEGMVYVMQNSMVRAIFDDAGRLLSLYDVAWQRELVPEGAQGNVFKLYEDIPLFWDAWDIEVYHLEKGWVAGEGMPPPVVTILENGPLRCRLGIESQLTPTSSVKQVVSLTKVSPRLDFHTEVVWSESRRALKVEFPWQLDAPQAAYEVQFGAVERPTHTNTSWDWARFEVCAHKWADLSEPGYGVALLNDCKYGHATHGNVMRLTLLRSPKAPDAHTDMGVHALRYGLLPHAHGWAAAGVAAHGWAFNAPLRLLAPPPPSPPPLPLTLTQTALRPPALAYNPAQPLFVVTSARPNPLGPPASSFTALAPPPLILDTVKLPEPPLPQPTSATVAAAASTAAGPMPTASAPASSFLPNSTNIPPNTAPTANSSPSAAGSLPHNHNDHISKNGHSNQRDLEDSPAAAIVVRLYEPNGARGVAKLSWPSWLRVTRVAATNLLEEELPAAEGPGGRPLAVAARGKGAGGGGGSVEVPYAPFKVITLKLYLAQVE